MDRAFSQDLSGQGLDSKRKHDEDFSTSKDENSELKNENKNLNIKTKHAKEIGAWGEKYVQPYIENKHPDNEVVCLNSKGNVGKGYDFVVIDSNGNEVKYYEVKSKLDKKPEFVEITGTQWEWARDLYDGGEGEKYTILVVSNAGSKKPCITPYNNPIRLWKDGLIKAHPVNFELR